MELSKLRFLELEGCEVGGGVDGSGGDDRDDDDDDDDDNVMVRMLSCPTVCLNCPFFSACARGSVGVGPGCTDIATLHPMRELHRADGQCCFFSFSDRIEVLVAGGGSLSILFLLTSLWLGAVRPRESRSVLLRKPSVGDEAKRSPAGGRT